MGLSEHEKTILEQISTELEHDDPEFASKMGKKPCLAKVRYMVIGSFVIVIGCLILLVGVAVHLPVAGVIGFIIMGAGAYLATMRFGFTGIQRFLASCHPWDRQNSDGRPGQAGNNQGRAGMP